MHSHDVHCERHLFLYTACPTHLIQNSKLNTVRHCWADTDLTDQKQQFRSRLLIMCQLTKLGSQVQPACTRYIAGMLITTLLRFNLKYERLLQTYPFVMGVGRKFRHSRQLVELNSRPCKRVQQVVFPHVFKQWEYIIATKDMVVSANHLLCIQFVQYYGITT